MSCGDLGFQIVLPFFTGLVFAYDPLRVGLVLAAYGIGIGLGGAIAESACRRYDERTVALVAIGALPITLLALIPLFGPNGSEWAMALVLAVYGVAWGLAYAILVNVIFRDVPEAASAMAGGIQSSMRLLAGALSAALLTAIFSGVSASRLDAVGNATRREHAIQMSSDWYSRKCHARCATIGPSDAAEIGAAYSIGAAATLAAAAGLSACAFGVGLLLPRRPTGSADRSELQMIQIRPPDLSLLTPQTADALFPRADRDGLRRLPRRRADMDAADALRASTRNKPIEDIETGLPWRALRCCPVAVLRMG
jgi:hypothetical protein